MSSLAKEKPRFLESSTTTASDVAGVIGDLKRRSEPYVGPRAELERDPAALANALDVLRIQHEELLVADDELRAQLEELHRAEELIAEERARSQEIFAFAPDAYVISDSNGLILECNIEAMSVLGHEAQWLIGKPLSMFIARTDAPALYELTRIAVKTKANGRLAVRQRAEGSALPTSVVVKKMGNEGRLFWRFRLDETPADRIAPMTVPVAPAAPVAASVGLDVEAERLRILVLSPDADAVDSVVEAAKHLDAIVETAETIPDAIGALKSFPAAVVVADLWSEGKLDANIMMELRLRNHRPMPLGIAMSGVRASDAAYAIKAGFHPFLVKPVSSYSAQKAILTLNRILLKRSARRLRSTPPR